MTKRNEDEMRAYWDDRARLNAPWYVDTSLDFDDPDLERFFETGRRVVAQALDGGDVELPGHSLAVEIGSGLGRICLALADRFERVVGLDISPEMIERSRELVDAPRVEFLLGDGASLAGIADESADLVLTFTVFQHIPDPKVIDGYIVEAGRVLRPGGMFCFQWNNTPGSIRWTIRRRLLGLLERSGLHRERFGRHSAPFLGSRVPLERIRRALARGGLELRRTDGLDTLYAWAWAERVR